MPPQEKPFQMEGSTVSAPEEYSIRREAYTVDEFAAAFGIGRTSAFKLFKDGKVRTSRILGRTVILRTEVDRFAASLQGELQ